MRFNTDVVLALAGYATHPSILQALTLRHAPREWRHHPGYVAGRLAEWLCLRLAAWRHALRHRNSGWLLPRDRGGRVMDSSRACRERHLAWKCVQLCPERLDLLHHLLAARRLPSRAGLAGNSGACGTRAGAAPLPLCRQPRHRVLVDSGRRRLRTRTAAAGQSLLLGICKASLPVLLLPRRPPKKLVL